MAKSFADYMTNGNLNVTTTSNSTKLTDHLRVWKTVYKYYQGQLNEIKRPNSTKALKSIKKLNDGEYQLKIQCGKYSHGLIEDTDESGNTITYNSGTYPTKQEAIEAYQLWIDGLKDSVPGIVNCVKPAWERYCVANKISV